MLGIFKTAVWALFIPDQRSIITACGRRPIEISIVPPEASPQWARMGKNAAIKPDRWLTSAQIWDETCVIVPRTALECLVGVIHCGKDSLIGISPARLLSRSLQGSSGHLLNVILWRCKQCIARHNVSNVVRDTATLRVSGPETRCIQFSLLSVLSPFNNTKNMFIIGGDLNASSLGVFVTRTLSSYQRVGEAEDIVVVNFTPRCSGNEGFPSGSKYSTFYTRHSQSRIWNIYNYVGRNIWYSVTSNKILYSPLWVFVGHCSSTVGNDYTSVFYRFALEGDT